jgi:hypothetical protein
MLAILVCQDRECRATYEVEGTREAIAAVRCEDCDGPLRAMAYADAEPGLRPPARTDVRRRAA